MPKLREELVEKAEAAAWADVLPRVHENEGYMPPRAEWLPQMVTAILDAIDLPSILSRLEAAEGERLELERETSEMAGVIRSLEGERDRWASFMQNAPDNLALVEAHIANHPYVAEEMCRNLIRNARAALSTGEPDA